MNTVNPVTNKEPLLNYENCTAQPPKSPAIEPVIKNTLEKIKTVQPFTSHDSLPSRNQYQNNSSTPNESESATTTTTLHQSKAKIDSSVVRLPSISNNHHLTDDDSEFISVNFNCKLLI